VWFHLEDFSGPHFVLENVDGNIPKDTLQCIGRLFRDYKTDLPKRYRVIYTQIRNVQLTRTKGTVIPTATCWLTIK
jgi:predicted ribosome quality control (RQC) complex YloA/Tae2 family protein